MPEWLKSTAFFLLVMICWDVVRLFLQALVNKWVMQKDFDKIGKAVEDVEEAMDEE